MKNLYPIVMISFIMIHFAMISDSHGQPSCSSYLQHYWKLQENTPGIFNDYAGTLDANVITPTIPVLGKVDSAQNFNGLSKANLVDDNTFDWIANANFTIEFWVNKSTVCPTPNTSNNNVIIGRDDPATQLHWWAGISCLDPGKINFNLIANDGSGINLVSKRGIIDGNWHHIVIIRNGSSATTSIYIDGARDTTQTFTYTAGFSSSVPINIGWLNLGTGYNFNGSLDELALYNRTISETEILEHYNGGAGADYCVPDTPSENPIRIMPLGNSITYDNNSVENRPEGDRISYRYALHGLLDQAGYNVDFVGSEYAGYNYFTDAQNAGFSGIRDDQMVNLLRTGYNPMQMVQEVTGPYLDAFMPDIILLHIGTNAVQESAADVEDILDEIDLYKVRTGKSTKVILARIINRQIYNTTTTTFNNNVVAMAIGRNNPDIYIVDMENGAGINYALDMIDNLHPNPMGYQKMAIKWFNKLVEIIPPTSPLPPTAFAVTGGGSYIQGGNGLPVGLADSETGVLYTLYKNNVAQVPAVSGTGEAITFGNQLFGEYTVSGTNGVGTTLMTSNAIITVGIPPIPNVAVNKPATAQGSVLTGREPSKANDDNGSNGSYWESYPIPKWWKVDLGAAYDLSTIVIRNYVAGGRYYQYTIEASLNDQTYTQIAQKNNTNAATDAGDSYAVNVTARYLRVNMTYNSTLMGVHITDFRAYGLIGSASSHVITASAGTGGSISPSGAVAVTNGTNQTFTITPGSGYQIADVLVDGSSVGAVASYTFNNVTVNHTISASFTAISNLRTITASAGTGGSISPSGAVAVADGTNQTFTITPGVGYQIADVLVDGSTAGAVTSYTFTNVTSNHTISATFTAIVGIVNVALNKPATAQGSVLSGREPSKANDDNGSNGSYWESYPIPKWWKVDLGAAYDLSSIVIRNYVAGGRYYQYTIEASLNDQTYTQIAQKNNTNAATDAGDSYAVNVTARYLRVNMTYNSTLMGVHITDFRAYGLNGSTASHVIGASAGTGGSISPSGSVAVTNGTNQTFTITPGVGYQIADVLVNGSSVGAIASYTFNNVTVNHTISASFIAISNMRTITASAGVGGSISPSGAVGVADGTNQTFTITPGVGYQVADVLVDGGSVGAVASYTFNNVTSNHTISATFTAIVGIVNVALNKPATAQGSVLTGREPSKANDDNGSNSSYWESYPIPKWWKVDLGAAYDLSSIVIRNYVAGGRYYQYTIEASLDDQTYTQIAQKNNTNAATNTGDSYSVNVTARYLRVNMTYNSTLLGVHITDFKAYGIVPALKSTSSPMIETDKIAEPLQKEIEVNVYPNPFNDHFTIRIDSPNEEMFDVSVIDLQGRAAFLKTEIPGNFEKTFNLELARGMYILIVTNKNGSIVKSIVKY